MSTEFNTDIYELREAVKKEIGYESFDDLKASKHVFADERKEYYAGKAPEYKDYFVWLKGLCDIYDVIEEKKKVSAETEKEREVKGEIYRKVNASYRNAFWEKRYKIGKLKFNAFSLIVLAGLFFVLLFIATLFNLLLLLFRKTVFYGALLFLVIISNILIIDLSVMVGWVKLKMVGKVVFLLGLDVYLLYCFKEEIKRILNLIQGVKYTRKFSIRSVLFIFGIAVLLNCLSIFPKYIYLLFVEPSQIKSIFIYDLKDSFYMFKSIWDRYVNR